MSISTVHFLQVEKTEMPSRKTPGLIMRFLKLEGYATDAAGKKSVFRYQFWPAKKDEALPELLTGIDYSPQLAITPHWETAELTPRIVNFFPTRPMQAAAPRT